MKHIYTLLALWISLTPVWAQQTISGTVKDKSGQPMKGAGVSIMNTLDGTSTDSAGFFSFSTTETGMQMLEIAATGFEPYQQSINLDVAQQPMTIIMFNNSHVLQQVSITAGSIGSADGSQKTVLETMDIVTTAGSGADPIAAMQMLPGVQRNGAQTGMMVRGGDASEAAIVVDNLVLQNPFFSDVPGVQQRSRFGAFQFKGIAFSSGGYSARYGQAMSSVLEMNTEDMPDESTVNLGLHMAGIYASGNKMFHEDKMSIDATAFYLNLKPFYGLATTNFDFYEPPTGGGGSLGYKWKNSKGGMLKVMGNFNINKSGIRLPNPFEPGKEMNFAMDNRNAFGQVSLNQPLHNKWKLNTAVSYSFNDDQSTWGTFPTSLEEERAQGRMEINWYAASKLKVWAGAEWQHIAVSRIFDTITGNFKENMAAGYLEGEWTPAHWLAFRPGVRFEHSELLGTNTISPRIAASVKANNYSQFSIASGLFYQSADKQYLVQGFRPEQQQAIHYIANYMYLKNDRTLRLEAYYKSYDQLVLEQAHTAYDPNSYRFVMGSVNNDGYGYAGGLELFWRDKKSVKNLDYWISYSYINTERLYKNFPVAASPDFISDHNLSLIGKYWIEKLSMMVSGTYSYASGKPYYDPANPVFLGDHAPDYHNVALQVSYLRSFGKWFSVFYISMDNVTNNKNVFGYRYSADGQNRYPIEPALFRSIFAGVNFSLTKFDKDEL